MNELITTGSQQLQKAIDLVLSLGLRAEEKRISPLVAIIEEIKDGGEEEALFLARLASEQVVFNDLVVKNVQGLEIGDVYNDIANTFASVRKDAKEAVEAVADGDEGFFDKIKSFFSDATKGTIAERFSSIIEMFDGVTVKLAQQVKVEKQIIEAYKIFRQAQGHGVVVALEFQAKLAAKLEEVNAAAQAAQVAVDAATDPTEKARLKIARDAAADLATRQQDAWQTSKDIAEDISNGHNVSDLVMADAQKAVGFKDRLYKRAASFMGNNQATIAAFAMSYTSKIGLADGTNAMNSMTKGMNDSLNDLADISGKVNENAIRAGYGATFDPNAVQRFAEALIREAEESIPLIEQQRKEAADNAVVIAERVEEARKRFVELSTKRAA